MRIFLFDITDNFQNDKCTSRILMSNDPNLGIMYLLIEFLYFIYVEFLTIACL